MIDRIRPADFDPETVEQSRKAIELAFGIVDDGLRHRPAAIPSPQTPWRVVRAERRLEAHFGSPLCRAYDDLLQRVPLVPRIDDTHTGLPRHRPQLLARMGHRSTLDA